MEKRNHVGPTPLGSIHRNSRQREREKERDPIQCTTRHASYIYTPKTAAPPSVIQFPSHNVSDSEKPTHTGEQQHHQQQKHHGALFQLRIRSHSGGARCVHGGAAAHAAAASAAAARPSLLPRRDHGGAHASRVLTLRWQRRRLRLVGSEPHFGGSGMFPWDRSVSGFRLVWLIEFVGPF
ncbi:hypothetical protein VNO80_26432 [Phaseolus coccineus]|uniref:Uncharacterized protein n=1 Tax=Phaseolus coccineus TaxID=3886 RepID=A0AAN9QH44_PHACN